MLSCRYNHKRDVDITTKTPATKAASNYYVEEILKNKNNVLFNEGLS